MARCTALRHVYTSCSLLTPASHSLQDQEAPPFIRLARPIAGFRTILDLLWGMVSSSHAHKVRRGSHSSKRTSRKSSRAHCRGEAVVFPAAIIPVRLIVSGPFPHNQIDLPSASNLPPFSLVTMPADHGDPTISKHEACFFDGGTSAKPAQ